MRAFRIATIIVALCATVLSAAAAGPTSPELVSTNEARATTGAGHSLNPLFSGDGRFVAFASQAANLVTNQAPSRYLNIYVRDLDSNITSLASANLAGDGGGNEDSGFSTISSNGQFVAFSSYASNLVPSDTNVFQDVFVRDLLNRTTSLVNVTTNGGFSSRGSGTPILSADGNRIVFESSAPDLVTNELQQFGTQLFVRDLRSNTTALVTVSDNGLQGGANPGGRSFTAVAGISANGRFATFISTATNLIAHETNQSAKVIIRDLDESISTCASAGAGDVLPEDFGGYNATFAAISADGSRVAYKVQQSSAPFARALIGFHRLTGASTLVSTNIDPFDDAAISADGEFVVYTAANQIWLTDLTTGVPLLVCSSNSVPNVELCRSPQIAWNARYIVFKGAPSQDGPWAAYRYDRESNSLDAVSLDGAGIPAEIVPTSEPKISRDGSRVVFESTRSTIVPGDLNEAADIFCYDVTNRQVRLISEVATPASSTSTRGGSAVQAGGVSRFGQFIAYTQIGDRESSPNQAAWRSVVVRDRVGGTNHSLMSLENSNGMRLAFAPAMSANGRYVAWYEQPIGIQRATNLCWLDRGTGFKQTLNVGEMGYPSPAPALSPDGRWLAFARMESAAAYTNVYLRDMLDPGAADVLVSLNRTGTSGGKGHSVAPSFSPNGKWLLFFSHASDLTTNQFASPGSVFPQPQVYARDLESGTTAWIAGYIAGTFRPRYPVKASMVQDHRYVFVDSALGPGTPIGSEIYRYDFASNGSITQVCSDCSNPSASSNGHIIAYRQRDNSSREGIAVRDFLTGETTVVSSNIFTGTTLLESSSSPLVSGDGRYIVFASRATNLVVGDTNGATDVFVHDRTLHSTFLVSRNEAGSPGNGASTYPVLAPDGRTVLFNSFADNLASGDFNNSADVFAIRLGGPDTDADGIDDQWELAYFGNLDRDGSGDADRDGASDFDEYRAGTSPLDHDSIFRVLSTTFTSGDFVQIVWNSEIGRRYRVQYKTGVEQPFWNDLDTLVTATASTAFVIDHPVEGRLRRFYRVVREP